MPQPETPRIPPQNGTQEWDSRIPPQPPPRYKEQLDVDVHGMENTDVHGVEALLEAQQAKCLATLEALLTKLVEPLQARLLEHEQVLTEKIEEMGRAHCAAVANAFPNHPAPLEFAQELQELSTLAHKAEHDECETFKESREDSQNSGPNALATQVPVDEIQQQTPKPGENGHLAATREKLSAIIHSHYNGLSHSTSALSSFRNGHAFRDILFSAKFELAMCSVILLNVFVVIVHVELEGKQQAYSLGFSSFEPNHDTAFDAIEKLFNAFYACELLPRMFFLGRKFFSSAADVFDLVVVSISVVESFLLQPLNAKGMVKLSTLRFFRLSRIFRASKFLRSSQRFVEIRVMLRTLRTGIQGVAWSIVLLSAIIISVGLLMAQFAMHFLDKDSIDMKTKLWLYDNFGTASHAIWTMFECTFTGGWRFYARPLVHDVSVTFALFWVLWVVFVNFTTIRIVASMFLKQTLKMAQVDEEKLAMENMKRQEFFAQKLRQIFQRYDSSGDGAISIAEFSEMLKDPDIIGDFKELDLSIDEVVALFGVLSSDDGDADYEEFLAGALKMNSSARTIDTIQVMHSQMHLKRSMNCVIALLESQAPASKEMGA